MAKYRFYSDTSFEFFLDDMEKVGADENVLEVNQNELMVEINDDWAYGQDDLEHTIQLWGGEKLWNS